MLNEGEDTDTALEIVDLKTHFFTPSGTARAVDGVSLRLRRGHTLGVLGESGSGKSVLSRTILGILATDGSVRTSGQIFLNGRDLRTLDKDTMRQVRGREIAMVFQDPMSSLNPVMPIGRQITEVLIKRMGMTRSAAKSRAIELLQSVSIPDPKRQMDRYPMHLSGGMRQRVAIAIALAGEPSVLIADEPTTALDVTTQAQILDLLGNLQRERDMSIILITHDLGVVAKYTDDVAVMYAGKLMETCATKTLIRQPRTPYTQALIRSAPQLSHAPHTRLEAIAGLPPNLLKLPKGCRFSPRCAHAQERCGEQSPPLNLEPGMSPHAYACWYPRGLTEDIVQ